MSLLCEHIRNAGVSDPAVVRRLLEGYEATQTLPAGQRWQAMASHLEAHGDSFDLHLLLFRTIFADWDPGKGPPPAWQPGPEEAGVTHVATLMRERGCTTYEQLHAWSATAPAAFWDLMVRRLGIRFARSYATVLDAAVEEAPRWLVGGRLNVVESCFLAGPEETALRFRRGEEAVQEWSYRALEALVDRVAHALVDHGIAPGDAVAIDMPMTPESVAIYLGIVKAGAVVVSIADSFAAAEIATRLRLGRARLLFTQDAIARAGRCIPLYERVVAAGAPPSVVLAASGTVTALELRPGDCHWRDFLGPEKAFAAVPRTPEDHANILFSSGTTGDPKAIPWSHTTPIKCAVDGYLHHDIRPGETVAWPTNLGWMMGPWLIFASLVNRAAIGLYCGAPGGVEFGRFVQDARVNMLGVVPSLVRAWRGSGCMEGLDWSAIRAFSSTGECSDPEDMLYLMHLAGYRPVIEYCGGTEIGGGYITGTMMQPASPGTFSTPALGSAFEILDEEGGPAEAGELFLRPVAMGLSRELVNADHHEVYFSGVPAVDQGRLRRHGDQMETLPGGYYRARGRVDDTMNLSGIKVSSAEIEEALARLPWLIEAAAVAVVPPDGGPSRLVLFLVVGDGMPSGAPRDACQQVISTTLNPLFRVHDAIVVDALPRTASNKVMRRVLRDRYAASST